jgi:hypothetical protein
MHADQPSSSAVHMHALQSICMYCGSDSHQLAACTLPHASKTSGVCTVHKVTWCNGVLHQGLDAGYEMQPDIEPNSAKQTM